MQPHQQRVVEEKKELDSKLQKLNDFIKSEKIKSLSDEEQFLLGIQSAAMKRYSEILDKRISIF